MAQGFKINLQQTFYTMQIELIDKPAYDRILEIQKNHPKLTFNNVGYQYTRVQEEDKEAFKEVVDILRKHIVGFSKFNNFQLTKDNEVRLRFQYDWTAHDRSMGIPFTGVGYLLLEELYKGFNNDTSRN